VVNGEAYEASKLVDEENDVVGIVALGADDMAIAYISNDRVSTIYVMGGSAFSSAGSYTVAVYYEGGEEPTRFVPNTTLDEVMNIAIANGYEGEYPKNIADAVAALGGVMGGGGGGGEGYTITESTRALMQEQTLEFNSSGDAGNATIDKDYYQTLAIGTNVDVYFDGTKHVGRVEIDQNRLVIKVYDDGGAWWYTISVYDAARIDYNEGDKLSGQHTVKADVQVTTVDFAQGFANAVKALTVTTMYIADEKSGNNIIFLDATTNKAATPADVKAAWESGMIVLRSGVNATIGNAAYVPIKYEVDETTGQAKLWVMTPTTGGTSISYGYYRADASA
jgi:hypothetical protein